MKMREFGKLSDGRSAGLFVLRNSGGMEVSVTDYGATLVSLIAVDNRGEHVDVVLGYSDVSGYENGHSTFGATVGRFANRIAGAKFTLNSREYELTANNGPNSLHGGRDFYSKRLWQTKIPFTSMNSRDVAAKANAVESMNDGGIAYVQDDLKGDSVTFCLDSPDGDQGYPGNLHIEVTYTLTNDNELHIDYRAISDADTPLNLTNHSYFNLSGHDSGTILDQICEIRAERCTPNDKNVLPTGEIREVAGTPLDFRTPKPIGAEIDKYDEQLLLCGGYDHNFVIDGRGYRKVASLFSEASGIHMYVQTDLPGMQLYTGNMIKDEYGKSGAVYSKNCGVCFETQFWPDAVNRENFPGGILKAGERFRSRTTYRFK